MITSLSSILSRLSALSRSPLQNSVVFASGRWWPQPELECSCRLYTDERSGSKPELNATTSRTLDCTVTKTNKSAENTVPATSTVKSPATVAETSNDVELKPEKIAPIYAPQRYNGVKVFGTVVGEGGELLADYVLFEESIQRSEVPWIQYVRLDTTERDIYMAHLKAVKQRKLTYKDPKTGYTVMTVSKLLLAGKCCGNGCRHCPYDHENMDPVKRRKMKFNGSFYV